MATLLDWLNVYTGIKDAVAGLQGNLAATKDALASINTRLTSLQSNQAEDISDELLKVRLDLDKISGYLKGNGNLDDLSVANQLTKIAHWISTNIAPNLGNLADQFTLIEDSFASAINSRLKELAQGAADPNTPLNIAMAQIAKALEPLTKEASPNFMRDLTAALGRVFQTRDLYYDWITKSISSADFSSAEGIEKFVTTGMKDIVDSGAVDVSRALEVAEKPFKLLVSEGLKAFQEVLLRQKGVDHAHMTDALTEVLGKAYQIGEAAHLAALTGELATFFKHMGLPQAAAALVDLAGFKPITGAMTTSLVSAAITRRMRWWGNDTFRPEVLPMRDLVELRHKREIEAAHFTRGLQLLGFDENAINLLNRAVWREPTIRDLAIAIEDTTVPDDWLLERVQKAGYSDNDADQLTKSLKQRALKAARGRVISAALAAVTDGLLDTESYRTILESLQLRQDEIDLQIRTAEIASRRDTVNTAIGTYKRQYVNDVIDRNDFVLTLTALGVNPDRVDLIALDADAQRAPKIAREEEAKLKASIREIQTELVPRYRRLYELGVIDDTAYENILIEAGISPQVAAQAVLLDRSKRQIVVQTATATALERETARLVAETEEALRLQFRKGLIDEAQLKNSLADLGYSDERVGVIVNQERARLAPPPGKVIEAPAEAKARVLRDLAVQTALNDFRKGRTDAAELFDALTAQGETEDEALARVNLEISRLPAPAA